MDNFSEVHTIMCKESTEHRSPFPLGYCGSSSLMVSKSPSCLPLDVFSVGSMKRERERESPPIFTLLSFYRASKIEVTC